MQYLINSYSEVDFNRFKPDEGLVQSQNTNKNSFSQLLAVAILIYNGRGIDDIGEYDNEYVEEGS